METERTPKYGWIEIGLYSDPVAAIAAAKKHQAGLTGPDAAAQPCPRPPSDEIEPIQAKPQTHRGCAHDWLDVTTRYDLHDGMLVRLCTKCNASREYRSSAASTYTDPVCVCNQGEPHERTCPLVKARHDRDGECIQDGHGNFIEPEHVIQSLRPNASGPG